MVQLIQRRENEAPDTAKAKLAVLLDVGVLLLCLNVQYVLSLPSPLVQKESHTGTKEFIKEL